MSDDFVEVRDPEQLALLSHPTRSRVLFGLGPDGATVSQLARRLRVNKGNVAHHLEVLERAGLVRLDRVRHVRGGTERYFKASAPRLRTPRGAGTGHTAGMLQAVAQEIEAAAGEPLLLLRHVRLSRHHAKALRDHLERIIEELDDAGDSQPRYGVLVCQFPC